MEHQPRPLFKHIRNHTALFAELAGIRDQVALSLNPHFQAFHKTPKFVTPQGNRLTIEPERSIVLQDYRQGRGLKSILNNDIPGLSIVPNSEIGFRYPTAALAGLDAPYIKRFRSEYFHRVDEKRDICRPINLTYGIKSRGKDDNREEYEVWIPEQDVKLDPSPLFINKYAEDLPDGIREFAALPPVVHGWMGVKRCAFEALYQNPQRFGDMAICVSLSLDAYNIGAKPDLSLDTAIGSSIARGGAEIEWEVLGFYTPTGMHVEHDHIWEAIHTTLQAIFEPLATQLDQFIVATEESKTERILSTINEAGVSNDDIMQLDLKPWEFLETHSASRTKRHDPSRNVNLLGRLNRLFYHTEVALPSLKELHFLAQQTG